MTFGAASRAWSRLNDRRLGSLPPETAKEKLGVGSAQEKLYGTHQRNSVMIKSVGSSIFAL
jgi:hypothetical protein